MTLEPSDRVREVPPSGIRKFFELAEERDDVISLGVGEPDFSTPWAARDAAIHSLERGRTSYTANRGMVELREAIDAYVADRFDLAYDPDEEILVTAGASEAVDLAFRAFVDPGDVVAVAQPSYVSYEPGVVFAGGEVLPVPTRREDDFRLTVEGLEAVGAGAADALVACYPNNPTGAVMRRTDLEPIAAFARDHDLTVLSDEVYAELTYDVGGSGSSDRTSSPSESGGSPAEPGPPASDPAPSASGPGTSSSGPEASPDSGHVSIAALEGMRERTVVFGGFSKSHAMTGLRLGYALAPPTAIDAMNRIHQYGLLSAPTTAQYAAVEALESCTDDVREMVDQYDRRRRFVLSRFREIGMDAFEARGAFYVFPEVPEGWTAEEFAEALLSEQGVAVVPGDVFGAGGEGHLRVSYATGLEDLREALARIETFVDDHA